MVQIDPERPSGHAAMSDQLVHDPSGQVNRDAESDAFVAPAVRGDRVVDPDDFALHVDQRATRVAGVDRGVGLEEVLIDHVLKLVHLAAAGADDSLADRVHQAERTSQRHHPVPDRGLVAISQPGCRQIVAVELSTATSALASVQTFAGKIDRPSRRKTRILAGLEPSTT